MYENSQLSFKRFSKYGIPIANLDKKGKEKIKKYLEKEEKERDLLWRFGEGIYSTDFDDYLYLYYTLYKLREGYNINFDRELLVRYFPKEELYNKIKTNKIPYVHLSINQGRNDGARSRILQNKDDDIIYCIEFDYDFLKDYFDFLIKSFDILFYNENKPENKRCYILTFGLPINQKVVIGELPAIYKTKGFYKFHTNSDYLISDLMDFAVEAIMAHELGHIGKGHIKYLDANNWSLGEQNKYARRMLEFDADTIGIIWLFGLDFLNGIEGPFDRNIDINLDDLIEHLELKIFTYYLTLRWSSLDKEVVWDNEIIQEENKMLHPKIQFRIMQMLINAFQRLDEILAMSDKDGITTKDNKRLTKDIIDDIKQNILQMITDFENVYANTKTNFTLESMIKRFEELSVVAKEELKKSYELWPDISKELEKYSYCNVNKYNISDL